SAPASTGPRAGSSAPRRPTSTPSGRARPSTSSSHPFGRNPPASSPSGARRRSSSSSNPFQRSRSNAPARSNPAMGTRPSSSSAPPLATASTPSSSSSSSGATRTPPPQRLKVAVTPAPSKAKPEQKSEPTKGKRKDRVRIPFPDHWPVPVDQFMFDPLDLELDVPVSLEKRKQILYYHYHLKRVSYYDLFNVPRSAKSRAIRRAYFTLSKEFHPDLFFRKELDRFQKRLEDVFKWLTEAYATLSNERKRQTYDRLLDRGYLGPWQLNSETSVPVRKPKPKTSSPSSRPAVPSGRSPRRGGGAAVERNSGARNWLSQGERAEARGDWVQGIDYYKQALEERFQVEAAIGLARCLLKVDRNMKQAEQLCRRVLREELTDAAQVDVLIVLARVLERQGRPAEAYAVYQQAQAIDPTNPVVRLDMQRVESSS
ncbi:MAG: DnaJ domain-containing protein, partial [Myxococcota bacterium]